MAAKAKKGKPKPKIKHGQVGPEVFEQVERLLASEKVGRTEAIRRVASKTGRLFGTVAANYYRVARQRGTKLRPRRTTKSRRRTGAGRRGAAKAPAVASVAAALEQAAKLLRQQQAEIARLQKENERFSRVRKLLRGA